MEILYIRLISKELILTLSLAAVQCLTTLCWHVVDLKALSNLIWLNMSLPMAGGWTR